MRRERVARGQKGSSLGEQVIMLALAALLVAVVVAAFSYSPAHGYTILGIAVMTGTLVFSLGVLRDRRMERRRVERCRQGLLQAATLEATFLGAAQGGPAAFGVAGADRKLVYAHENGVRAVVTALDFDEITAAFARPDGERFRLEVRTRRRDGHAQDALFLLVERRDEAVRWIQVLQPYLGERARMVPVAPEPGP